MKLSEYFTQPKETFFKSTSETGERSDWLEFCELQLKGSKILVVDAQFVPSENDGLLVDLPPGRYYVQTKLANFGGDRRFSRLRSFRLGSTPQIGGKIGETWTDTAKTGICDFETFSKAWGKDDDASYKIIEPFFETFEAYGIAVMDAASASVMPFVNSGFGDGTFSVFELLESSQRVGFEIEFILDDEKYSLGEMPFQRQSRVTAIENKANHGVVEAQMQLARMYEQGDGVRKSLEQAADWLEKASISGSPEAALKLGVIYKTGKAKPQDFARAREFFELAASRGSVSALNELGIIHRHGQGVPADNEKAINFYRQAAEKGFSNAQYNLAVHYSKGLGIPQDYVEAARLYRQAADQGNLKAIYNLGCFYRHGKGVSKDEKEAARLFEIGAKEGHPESENNLGDCYETGCGVGKRS